MRSSGQSVDTFEELTDFPIAGETFHTPINKILEFLHILIVIFFKILAILVRVKWYFIVVFVYIS